VAISLGYFIYSKNQHEPPKVAQFAKKIIDLVTLIYQPRYFMAVMIECEELNLHDSASQGHSYNYACARLPFDSKLLRWHKMEWDNNRD
jgi:hypothetical protein